MNLIGEETAMKEKILTKKNIIIAASLAAAAVVIIIAAVVFGKNSVKPEQPEAPTTQLSAQADIVAVTITDSNGKSMVVEGVAVVDEDGNATITAKDSEGNELIVKGAAQRDSSGKLTVKNPEIVGGSVIKDSDGNEILVGESNVSQVDDNNSGDIQTDVSLDDETKEAIKNENNNSGNASGNTEGNNTPAQPEEHQHVWSERTETIHHDEQGHWEDVQVGTQTVVDSEAYDEVIYNDTPIYICDCGKTFDDSYAFEYHQMNIVDLDGDWGPCAYFVNPSYHPINTDVNFKFYYEAGTYVMGTQHHEAVTHEEPVYESRYVVDSAAYDETVTTTYCTGCGAVK